MSNPMPPNVLFFSKNCKTCNTFITMCQQNKILKYFRMVDVDDKIAELSQKGLKVVPTIIIKGLTKPIEGKNVFTWLESIISMNSNKKIDTSGDQYLPETGITQQQRPSSGAGTTNPNNNVVKRTVVPPPIIGAKQEKETPIQQTKLVNGVEIKTTPSVIKDFIIYPNPATDGQFNVVNNKLNRVKQIEIYNAQGQLIKSISNCTTDLISINLNASSGIYTAVITGEKNSETHRIAIP